MKSLEFLKNIFKVDSAEKITDAMIDDFLSILDKEVVDNGVKTRNNKKSWDQPVKIKAVGDEKTCPVCKKLDGKTMRKSEAEEILRTKTHPGCRCKIIPVK